jgi:peroxiredoxin
LRRFETMKDELERRGVTLVALSKDDVETAAMHRRRDGLSFTVLADPQMEVIRQFGLEHHKALEFSKGGFTLFGIPLALMPEVKSMAIPTTLLVDEDGTIRWVDQTDDYRLRSRESVVLAAIDDAFEGQQPAAR